MWGYADEAQRSFQLPGPVLCVDSGATVTVVLHNHLPEATSIIFPGQHSVTADGHPAGPEKDADGNVVSMVPSADAVSADGATPGSVTYTFVAGSPGTYLYKSGTDADVQDQMGLYGALVVRPPRTTPSSTTARTRPSTRRTSTSSCCPRSTPTSTSPSSATTRSTGTPTERATS